MGIIETVLNNDTVPTVTNLKHSIRQNRAKYRVVPFLTEAGKYATALHALVTGKTRQSHVTNHMRCLWRVVCDM